MWAKWGSVRAHIWKRLATRRATAEDAMPTRSSSTTWGMVWRAIHCLGTHPGIPTCSYIRATINLPFPPWTDRPPPPKVECSPMIEWPDHVLTSREYIRQAFPNQPESAPVDSYSYGMLWNHYHRFCNRTKPGNKNQAEVQNQR